MYQLQTAKEAVVGYFKKDWVWNYPAGFEAANRIGPSAKKPASPSNHRLVVKDNEFVSMRWRFESKWMRDKGVKVPINARSETIFANGLFKFSARDRRCLIICDGFFEPKGPKGTKRDQYLFTFEDSRPFALGGLWTKYRSDDDEFEGFVIVTTTPNNQVSPIHGRMPVILDGVEEWEGWMHGNEHDIRRLYLQIERPKLRSGRYEQQPINVQAGNSVSDDEPVIAYALGERCPACGSPLETDGCYEWCSDPSKCDYGTADEVDDPPEE